jgi:hypothetical protein
LELVLEVDHVIGLFVSQRSVLQVVILSNNLPYFWRGRLSYCQLRPCEASPQRSYPGTSV